MDLFLPNSRPLGSGGFAHVLRGDLKVDEGKCAVAVKVGLRSTHARASRSSPLLPSILLPPHYRTFAQVLLPQCCCPTDARSVCFQRALAREASFLYDHQHPNIIRCHGLIHLDPMAPEYVKGLPKGYGKYPVPAAVLELCEVRTISTAA